MIYSVALFGVLLVWAWLLVWLFRVWYFWGDK